MMLRKRIFREGLDYVVNIEPVVIVPLIGLVLFDGNRRIGTVVLDRFLAKHAALGAVELLLGAILLWATVSRWAKWVPAFVCLAALKATFSVWSGTMFSFPDKPIPRVEAALVALCGGAVALLTWQFVTREPEGHEKVALFMFVLSTFPLLFFRACPLVAVVSLSLGLAALVFSRVKSCRRGRDTRSRQSENESGTSIREG